MIVWLVSCYAHPFCRLPKTLSSNTYHIPSSHGLNLLHSGQTIVKALAMVDDPQTPSSWIEPQMSAIFFQGMFARQLPDGGPRAGASSSHSQKPCHCSLESLRRYKIPFNIAGGLFFFRSAPKFSILYLPLEPLIGNPTSQYLARTSCSNHFILQQTYTSHRY